MRTSYLAVALALATGCGGAPRHTESLMESVMTYNDGVRWERLPAAASRVPAAEREDFIDERDQLAEELKITDWEVVRVRGEREGARVHVKYTWYALDIGTVHETHAMQRWQQRGTAWVIIDEHRLRGEEMPGLSEAPDDAEAGDAASPTVDVEETRDGRTGDARGADATPGDPPRAGAAARGDAAPDDDAP